MVSGEGYFVSFTATDFFSSSVTVNSSVFTAPTRDYCDTAPTITLAGGDAVDCSSAYAGDDVFAPVVISAESAGNSSSIGDSDDLGDAIVARYWTLVDQVGLEVRPGVRGVAS